MGLGLGDGTAISGFVEGGSAILGATLASRTAKKEREQKTNIWNKDTKLKLAQFSMNQGRLAGLAGVAGGEAARAEQRLLTANGGQRNDKFYEDRKVAYQDVRANYEDKGDYKTLKASDYTI